MRLSPLLCLFAVCAAAVVSAEPQTAAPAPAVSAEQQTLDSLVSLLEDVAAALDSVSDTESADLVAPRVAVDFIAMSKLHAAAHAASENIPADADFAKSFMTRSTQARRLLDDAVCRLKEHNAYGSRVLPSALSFSSLLTDSLPESRAAESAAVLLAHHRAQMTMLLARVQDAATAAEVAELLQAMLTTDDVLAAFAAQHADGGVTENTAITLNKAEKDLEGAVSTLRARDFYGNTKLRTLLTR